MTVKELEQRVIALEQEVRRLQRERASSGAGRNHDWEATVEKYKGDEDILAVLRDAMKLREKERRAVHKRRPGTRRALK